MEYEHEMNAFMTPDGGEAFTLEGTLCPDAAQSADTYAFTLEAGVAPGPDGLQGGGRLMIGTEDMPELTGLSFELHEAEPSAARRHGCGAGIPFGGTVERTDRTVHNGAVGLPEAMPVRQTAE